jgi:hypothetical protein
MSLEIPAALLLLSVADSGFAGFRAAAGCDAHVFKAEYYRRAIRRGIRRALVANAFAAAGLVAWVLLSASPEGSIRDFVTTCHPVLWVVGIYAALVLVALGVWAAGEADVRTLASVLILGPFTLIRPWVIVLAAVLGIVRAPSVAAGTAIGIICAGQLTIEPLLARRWRSRLGDGWCFDSLS